MNDQGQGHTYQSISSNWEISPPLPTIQRFPSPPSSSPSYSPDSDSHCSTRFNFDFDFDFDSYSHFDANAKPDPLPLVSPRKAPLPPVYSPRRARARHIRMQEPAKLGLFTVSESEEEVLGESSSPTWYSDLSIALSTPTTSPYLSASSSFSSHLSASESESEAEVETPLTEFDDPFSTPPTTLPILDWSYTHSPRPPPPTPRTALQVPTLAAAVNAGNFQPRRPPPLALHLITRPRDLPSLDYTSSSGSALSPSPLSFHCQLSAGGTPLVQPLAPALPIRSNSTPQKRRSPDTEVDLVSALEELFTSCGEDLSDVSPSVSVGLGLGLDQFPLPPSRSIPSISISASNSRSKVNVKSRSSSPLSSTPTPVSATYLQTPTTPPPTRYQSIPPSRQEPPPAPRQKQRRMTNRQVQFEGDHSFLMDMARSPSATSSRSGSSSSRSSGSSSRGLPRRSSIPSQWIGNPI
jgi:hypothetical protein